MNDLRTGLILLWAASAGCLLAGCKTGAKASPAEFERRVMESEVRGVLGLLKDVPLTDEHYQQVKEFRPSFNRLTTAGLVPVSRMSNLEVLGVPEFAEVDDLTCLSGLSKLRALSLKNTKVRSIAPLASLKNLKSLNLDNCAVSDLSPLAGMENLRSLSLSGTAVTDIAPLAELRQLEDLYLDGTGVKDLSALRGVASLTYVSLPDGSGWNGPRDGAPPSSYAYDYHPIRKTEKPAQAGSIDYTKFGKAVEIDGSSPAVISSDGRWVAGEGRDRVVQFWDIGSGSAGKKLGAYPTGVACLALSADGSVVASAGSFEKAVRLTELESGKERKIEGHSGAVSALAFAPSGTLLASAGKDKAVRVMDATTNVLKHTFKHGGFGATSLAFSPDSQTLASGGGDGDVVLWDLPTGSERARFDHKYVVEKVAFSADGAFLAVANGPDVAIYDANGGTKVRAIAGQDKALCVAFSPDGKTLATGSPFGEIILWDAGSGKKKGVLLVHGKRASSDAIRSVAFTPDGRFLVGAGSTIQVWSAKG